MEHKLEVDVHAHWNDQPPVYRLYIDNELFTERTFGWTAYQFYLTENMYCDLETGVHTLRLEKLDLESRFNLDNFKVNDVLVNKNLLKSNGSTAEWRFIIDLINHQPVRLNLDSVSRPTPLAPPLPPVPPPEKPGPNLALIQRMRELNNRAAKK